MTVRLADTHCHLSLDEFEHELEEVLSRAVAAGVDRILVPGIDLATSRRAIELAERTSGVYAAVGIHPHNAFEWDRESERELRDLAASPSVVAVGELGLDFYRENAPHKAQRVALDGQLMLAAELSLPVVVHNREATEELLELLIEWAAGLEQSVRARAGVLHAFSENVQAATKAISAGFYVGVAGPVTYPNAEQLRSTLADLPAQNLVIETDAPYLAPQARRGKRNEPSYLPFIAHGLAVALGTRFEQITEITSANASRLFGWSHGSQDSHIH
jgi:TatD DNase family protein